MTSSPFLELRNIVKEFPGVRAVDGVDLTVQEGEVVGLIGENGAGKSTLMKIAGGIYTPDEGEILVQGTPVGFHTVSDAQNLGIELIHQELNLVPNLDVAANLFLGRESDRLSYLRPFDFSQLEARSHELLDRVQLRVSPKALVGDLTTGQQQKVAIARALSRSSRLIVMDEPTASLTREDSQNLFEIIRDLRSQKISIVYASHRLEEVLAITNRIVCLRDGRKVGELNTQEATIPQLIQMMVGRKIEDLYPSRQAPVERFLLEVEDLRLSPGSEAVSFHLRAGEILGFAGLIGAGRTELMQALFGVRRPYSGQIRVKGQTFLPQHPPDSIRAGIAMVPEDRKEQGLVIPLSVRENLTLPFLRRVAHGPVISLQQEQKEVQKLVEQWRIKASSSEQIVQFLSGGNQQKIVLAKWLVRDPEILILDEPTRGIDVGTKREIYHLIGQLASRGLGILLVSSEMEELLGICHRIIVMREGRLTGEVSGERMTEEHILALATASSHTGTETQR